MIFIRYNEDRTPEVQKFKTADVQNSRNSESIQVRIYDPVLQTYITLETSMIVLSSAIIPEDNIKISQMLKIPLDKHGFFLEAHMKLRPVDCTMDGIF